MSLLNAASAHLLVVDDDGDIRNLLIRQLEPEGYRLTAASDVAGVRSVLGREGVDLIVLDLNLPDGDGLSLCRELRSQGYDGAIIMVTARDSGADRVLGLELGADDYLTKPFEPRELIVRIRNLLRRTHQGDAQPPRGTRYAHFGQWRLDLLKRRLVDGNDGLVMLSTAEFKVLSRFLNAPRQVLSREFLMPERAATAAFDRSIDLLISRLRQKLARGDPDEIVLTVRNQGYVLACDIHYS